MILRVTGNWKERLGTVGVVFASALLVDVAIARFPVAPPGPGLAIARLTPLAWGLPLTFVLVAALRRLPVTAGEGDAPSLSSALGEIAFAFVLLALASALANLARNTGRAGIPILLRPSASAWLAGLASIGAVAAGAVRDRSWEAAARIHLSPARAVRGIGEGFAAALALVPLLALGVRLVPEAFPREIPLPVPLTGAPELSLLLFLLPAAVLPLAEEVLFRGRLLPALSRRLPAMVSVFAQAVLFAGLHFDPDAFVPRLAAGILLGALRLRTGDLWASWAFHAFFNAGLLVLPFVG